VKRLSAWTPDVWEPRGPVGSIFARIVDDLIAEWVRHDQAGDTEVWCLRVTIPPIVDSKCSRLRTILGDKLNARGDIPPLSICKQWVTPCQRDEHSQWIHRKQEVRLRLVPRMDDARTENLLEWMRRQEHEQGRKRKFDAWQRRTRKNSIMSKAPELPPISAELDILRRSYRLRHDGPHWETIDAFKIRLDISDDMTLEEWAAISKYPVGENITPEQEAAWLAVWAPDGMPEPARPETFQEQQLRWMREGGWNEQEKAANQAGHPMPKMMVQPGVPAWQKEALKGKGEKR
jgi:hypothetical protein